MSNSNSNNATCGVCCEKYNKSTHNRVVCEYSGCGYESCKVCVRTYLLGTTNDPHCMNCKNQWTSKFMVESLNRSYIDNDYKKHRKNLLAEREISRTPELMVLVERTKLVEEETKELHLMMNEFEELRKMVNTMRIKIGEKNMRIFRIRNGEHAEKDERKKFIMPCPGDDCKGYLSSHYKCELCKLYVCPDCFEVIGHNKEDAAHVCKEDNLKSAEMIKKETKGCPKCGVRIFKISGCDQMWCTECKVAFSWNTGKIVVDGAIHNPHFYQYMQNNNAGGVGVAPRNPGDVLCGGLLSIHNLKFIQAHLTKASSIVSCASNSNEFVGLLISNSVIKNFIQNLKTKPTRKYVDFNLDDVLSNVVLMDEFKYILSQTSIFAILNNILSNLHRVINHITNVDLENCRRLVRQFLNHDEITVQYILNRKSKEDLANAIYKNDNERKKNVEKLNVYELLSVVGIERFNELNEYFKFKSGLTVNLIVTFIYEIVKLANEYNQLIEYCNNQLITISYTLGMSVSTIIYEDYSYNSKSNKFTLNEYNKIKNGVGAGPGLGLGAGVEKKENNEEASCSYINNK
uniref:RING-type domain-containing protein n=1 Tax=viral metagenome TaxID=1070528 RepID=A0A6C0KTI2_9ZZZZ